VLYIAYALSQMVEGIDVSRLLKMCLFHDLPETRMGDLNYVNKKYVHADEERILGELEAKLPFGREIASLVKEFNEKGSNEAQLANDADQLDLLLHVKEQADIGNLRAGPWIDFAFQRLLTKPARQLAMTAMKTDSTDWWFEKVEEERSEK
jgi:putative hydrolase of HD superfamily